MVSTAAWACIEFLPALAELDLQPAADGLNSRLGLHWVFTTKNSPNPLTNAATSQQPLGLALSFYMNYPGQFGISAWGLNSRLGLHWVFTPRYRRSGGYFFRRSQQPLGLALSFYASVEAGGTFPGGMVSTAAWACIEFLLYDVIYLQYQGFASLFRQDSKKLRQKPISIWQKRKNSTQNNSAWDTPSQPKYSHAENLRIIKHIQEDDWDDWLLPHIKFLKHNWHKSDIQWYDPRADQ